MNLGFQIHNEMLKNLLKTHVRKVFLGKNSRTQTLETSYLVKSVSDSTADYGESNTSACNCASESYTINSKSVTNCSRSTTKGNLYALYPSSTGSLQRKYMLNKLNSVTQLSLTQVTVKHCFQRTPINCTIYCKDIMNTNKKYFSTAAMATSKGTDDTQVQHEHKKVMIVGLGNHDLPNTRHSVGMLVVDRIAQYLQADWRRERAIGRGFVTMATMGSTGDEGSVEIILLKSRKAMNENGKTIVKAAEHFGVEPKQIYLVHDNLDKPVGKFGIKIGGSARGHNGVRSAIASLKTDVMPRLWIGIDRPEDRVDVADYVLRKFATEERKIINGLVNPCIFSLATHIEKEIGVSLISQFTSQDSVEQKS